MTSHILHLRASTSRRPSLATRIGRIVERWEGRRYERKLGYHLPAAELFKQLNEPGAPTGARKSRRARQHLSA